MIRALGISFWAMALMAGSIYYFAVMAGASTPGDSADGSSLEIYDLDTSSFPVVRENEIRGYIVLSALFSIVSENRKNLPFPLEYQIRDGLLETILADREIDIFQIEKVDLGQLKRKIMSRVNSDHELVRDIKFKSFDYLSKNEIRDMKMRRY